jgi:cellulose synthase/poly-beta-1,6-N-acetylglucosamine synthase-like glycosyltransferase
MAYSVYSTNKTRAERFFELLPATLAWGTLIAIVLASWLIPVWAAIFIILFDTYWLLKSVFLAFHLRSTYQRLRENLKVDWLAKIKSLRADEITTPGVSSWEDIRHLIMLPMYSEPYELVRESFKSLATANYPLKKFDITLALEGRAGADAQLTAKKIEEEFGSLFASFLITVHPENQPGEIPGKGSNEAYAGKFAVAALEKEGIDPRHVIVSVFDVDTQIPSGYFGRVAHAYLTSPEPLRKIYQPVPFFTNNVYDTPALGRVIAWSCTFWQMMQQSRPERLTTFSSQAAPLQLLIDVGFWHKDVVSEDSRIFWQAYFRYDGDFSVIPLSYPVYMDANVVPSFWKTLLNLYKQQRRWGWGVENVPYMLSGFIGNKKIALRKKAYWTFSALEGFHSWATNSIMIFALGWLPLMLGGAVFNDSLLSYNLPRITRSVITLSMVTIVSSAIMAIVLLPPRPKGFKTRQYAWFVLQWLLLPVSLIIFGAFPGLEAQTRLALGGRFRLGFWVTPKTRGTASS